MIDTRADKCVICDNEFYIAKMTDGKCDVCNARYPDIMSKAELLESKEQAEKEKDVFNEGTLKNIISNEVDLILKKYGILLQCDCGKYFYRKGMNQKTCSPECRNKSK